jgi:hypothetical protein
MWTLWGLAVLLPIVGLFGEGQAEDALGTRPLLTIAPQTLHALLPDSRILIDARSMEQFLDALDKTPPDWSLVFGQGHHNSARDERLFTLNRERDANRAGSPALTEVITFIWAGELSRYDREAGGFRVVLGPTFTPTRWGLVRFKYEYVQGDLVAKASETLRKELESRLAQGEQVEIAVAMTGRLTPDESVIYDFSHDQEGVGVIMPVVKIERIDYLLANQ